jgi:hypothetical protein
MVATTSTPTHVIQLRRSITQFVASFSRLAKPPITWCRKKFVCWLSVTQLLSRSNQFGTPPPSTQLVGKPLWKPLVAMPITQITAAPASGSR